MQSDKISLFNYLKSRYSNEDIGLQQILVVIHQNAITLNQARKFLFDKVLPNSDWRAFSKEEFLHLSEQSYRFIIENRAKWIQQRKAYENSLLKFHDLYQRLSDKSQAILMRPKIQLLQQLKDERTKVYFIANSTFSDEDFKLLLSNLQTIVHYESEAGHYIKSNDYELNQIINNILEEISQNKLNKSIINPVQTKSMIMSPLKKMKTSPGSLPKSHSITQIKRIKQGKQYLIRNNSQKSSIFQKRRRNFIQQVRQEIKQDQIYKTISRKESESSSVGSNRLVSIHLPKILKLSDEQISTQGIYKSLKKFANFDYVAQQKKIRDIIGISLGQDEQFMSAYFNKEMRVKQQKQQQQHQNRQQRRKKILESLTKKQHHCRKYNPQEVQPYMRF